MSEPTQHDELAAIILAGLSCVNSSSIHPDGNRCRAENYGCIWYARRVADALIPFIERAKADELASLEVEVRDARTLDLPTQAAICAGIKGRERRLRDRADAIEKGTEG